MVYNRMTARVFARYYGAALYMREVSNGALWRDVALVPCADGSYVMATRNLSSGSSYVKTFDDRKQAIEYLSLFWDIA